MTPKQKLPPVSDKTAKATRTLTATIRECMAAKGQCPPVGLIHSTRPRLISDLYGSKGAYNRELKASKLACAKRELEAVRLARLDKQMREVPKDRYKEAVKPVRRVEIIHLDNEDKPVTFNNYCEVVK